MLVGRRRHLQRWKVRAARRRERLRHNLAQPVHSLGPLRQRNWLRRFRLNLATRKAWLEARLAHLHALERLANPVVTQHQPVPTNPRSVIQGVGQRGTLTYQVPVRRAPQPPPAPHQPPPKAAPVRKRAPVGNAAAGVVAATPVARHAPTKRRKQK
jgi:hypothetical protein